MAIQITPAKQGEDSRKLWQKMDECFRLLRALENMECRIEGRLRMIGKLEVKEGSSTLKIHENQEVGSRGT